MKKLLVLGFISTALLASDAFADIAVDPCTGKDAGDACIVDAGGSVGVCVDLDGSLECQATPTNNGTNNANNETNNATNKGETPEETNNVTPPPTDPNPNPDKSSETKDDGGGCTTAGGGGFVSVLIGLALVAVSRVRR